MSCKIVALLKNLLSITSFLVMAACAHEQPARTDTIRVCDDKGCTDRPRGYASPQPATALPAEDTAQVTALEQLAANDPRAAYDLALRFFRGDGVRQDSYRSLKWMREAAERGDVNAQKALGRLYLTGLGEMGADPGEAEKWLSITASRGDQEAATLLAEATEARQSAQAEYRWYQRWKPVFYTYWHSRYVYYFNDLRVANVPLLPPQTLQTSSPATTQSRPNPPSSPPVRPPVVAEQRSESPPPAPTRPPVVTEQRSESSPPAPARPPVVAEQRPAPPASTAQLPPPGSEARTALVIGNTRYLERPLRTPENDARELHAVLRNLGFDATLIENGGRRELIAAIEMFGGKLRRVGGVGLVFYAGHGVQIKGKNYLIPVDAQVQSEVGAVADTIDVDLLLGTMAEAGTRINVIILDACRDNPFERRWRSGGGRGLAITSSDARGTLIAYSTDPGKVAADGHGEHSPYAKALLEVLRVPNLSIEQVFKRVRQQVQEVTAGAQTPWETSNLTGDFFFALR